MLREPNMMPRALFCCLKSATAQQSNIAGQLPGITSSCLPLSCIRMNRHICSLLKQCITAGTSFVRNASCTRTHQVNTTSCYTSDQDSGPDISRLHPRLQRQWDHTGNARLGNVQITPHSARRVGWVCGECPLGYPHKWTATVDHRTTGTQCPFCAGRKPCEHNCLATQAPAIAAEFSNKNKGTPHDYTVHSNKKLNWQCQLGHEWTAQIASRTSDQTGCPSCFVQQQRGRPKMRHPVLTGSQHPMMQHWDWEVNAKAGLDPSQITCRSNKQAHWICLHCPRGQPHKWQASVGDMYDGTGCPCCCGRKACICNSLQSLAPKVAAEWDDTRNEGTPNDYTVSSTAKVWWHNDIRGSFQAAICVRTYVRKPQPGS